MLKWTLILPKRAYMHFARQSNALSSRRPDAKRRPGICVADIRDLPTNDATPFGDPGQALRAFRDDGFILLGPQFEINFPHRNRLITLCDPSVLRALRENQFDPA